MILFSDESNSKKSLPSLSNWINWILITIISCSGQTTFESIKITSLNLTIDQFADKLNELFVYDIKRQLMMKTVVYQDVDEDVESLDESDLINKEIPTYQYQLSLWKTARMRNKAARLKELLKKWKHKVRLLIIWNTFIKIIKARIKEKEESKPKIIEKIDKKPIKVEPKSIFVSRTANGEFKSNLNAKYFNILFEKHMKFYGLNQSSFIKREKRLDLKSMFLVESKWNSMNESGLFFNEIFRKTNQLLGYFQ
jgi:hypothetical protein